MDGDQTLTGSDDGMRLALAVSLPDARFSALVYREPFARSFAKAAALGCAGIEVALRDAGIAEARVLARLAERYGLRVCALGTGQIFGTDGLSFTDPDPEVRRLAIARVKGHIELAGALGAPVIIGLVRGKGAPGESTAGARRLMLDGLAACLAAAERAEVDLALEPINRYETNLLNTVQETLAIAEELGSPRVGLLVDTFHMNIEEPSISASIRRAGPRIKHVHIADSNRWAPGFGHIDFAALALDLSAVGYEGFLSAEILPYPDPDTAAQMFVRTMRHCAGSGS